MAFALIVILMTSGQQTSLRKSSKPYLINTRTTKRDIDLKPIYKMIENTAELPPISANERFGFSGRLANKKHFLLIKIVLIQILILNCRLSSRMMQIAG